MYTYDTTLLPSIDLRHLLNAVIIELSIPSLETHGTTYTVLPVVERDAGGFELLAGCHLLAAKKRIAEKFTEIPHKLT